MFSIIPWALASGDIPQRSVGAALMLGAADDDGKGVVLGCHVGIRDCTLVGLGLYDGVVFLVTAVGADDCAESDVGL